METINLDTGETLTLDLNYIQSIEPSETLFGYTYWSYMIPPEQPKDILILGYGNGTIANLIYKICVRYKFLGCLGIDIREPKNKYLGHDFIQRDAKDFIKTCDKRFDYVVIDLYNGNEICDFVFDEDFVKGISKVCSKRISINLFKEDFGKEIIYDRYFKKEIEKPILNNKVIFFRNKEDQYGKEKT